MNLNDIAGVTSSLKELGDISMSGVVVIFALMFLIMFIGMFLSQNKNVRALNKANQASLHETIALYEKANNDMHERLEALELDKNEILIEFRKERAVSTSLNEQLEQTQIQLERATIASEDCIKGRRESQIKMEHLEKTIRHLEDSLTSLAKQLADKDK